MLDTVCDTFRPVWTPLEVAKLKMEDIVDTTFALSAYLSAVQVVS